MSFIGVENEISETFIEFYHLRNKTLFFYKVGLHTDTTCCKNWLK